MADFEEQRARLVHLRAELERNREQGLLAHEAVRQSERALADLTRTARPNRDDDRARIEKKLQDSSLWAEQLSGERAELRGVEAEVLQALETVTDPRQEIGRFGHQTPILLFPLRLETRFKSGGDGQAQLWLRVFPDTCLIDTFEPALTEQEIANAQAFWQRMWQAAGDEALERAAWRGIVAAHGSGRAGWVVRNYLPLNPSEKPLESDGADVRLIVLSNGPESAAVAAYWEAAWKAVDDSAAQQAAYAALQTALGAVGALDAVERLRPFNFNDAPPDPLTRADAVVKATVLQVPAPESLETRRTSWSSAARIELLPERFVFLGYSGTGAPLTAMGGVIRTPLAASPDPNAPPEQQLQPVDDQLEIPPEIAWMFDFDKAVEAGMAMRIDLTADQAKAGFDRVVVLGVRLADTPDAGRDHLAKLLRNHLHSRAGLEIVRQGTPTNNTEKEGAGYSFRDDPDASFDIFVRELSQYAPESDPLLRSDGEWLAQLLGLPDDLVQRIPNAAGADQSEARSMQIALWPGTLGYMMKSLLAPVFSGEDVDWTREFFTRYVTGRGPLPALRIGRQPYGILPTMDFARMKWDDKTGANARRLYDILLHVDTDWKSLVDQISFIGKKAGAGQDPLDPHQILLDVLGLHAGSVEYHPLQAESVEHKYYELTFFNYALALGLLEHYPVALPMALLRTFGYKGEEVPDLLNKIYKARQTPLDGPVIDDRPLSETEPIRDYAGDRNYIEWLADAARSGIEALQQESGFDAGKPAALLYLLLRHSLQLAFHETGVKLQLKAGELENAGTVRKEPAFVHVSESQQASESRYDVLYRTDGHLTGAAGVRVGDYIARYAGMLDPELQELLDALGRLAAVPTARLERVFAEHLDCCGYRLDAWKMGLYTMRLEALRAAGKRGASGLQLGAFGWLEPLRPQASVLTPADLPDELAARVNQRDTAPLMRDSGNAGLVHAPSLNHATTAAVLRNGYLANEGQLAVNLTSRRVRLALGILEGMRGGQSLGALLGYQFERHVHDHGPLQVRDLIYPLRREFPLAANQIASTNTETGDADESIAAMNVVDGRKLIERVEPASAFTYPFGVASLPRRDAAQEQAITDALAHIRDINDAVADLVLAEGVHQAVLGNYERSGGTLDAFAKGNYPPEPEVIRTPRTGIGLTLRTAIHFAPDPPADPLPGIPLTPLATAEPAVNAWLAQHLPAPASVGCNVVFTDRGTDLETTVFVTQEQLGLHPNDLLYRVRVAPDQALGDLDERILQWVQTARNPRHDRKIRIAHTTRVDGRITWFELQALLKSLGAVVIASRPLQAADVMRANDATEDQQASVSLPAARVEAGRTDWNDTLIPILDAAATDLNDATVSIDDALSRFAAAVSRFAAYRVPQTGTGFVYEWRARTYTAIAEKLEKAVKSWNERLAQYDARIAAYDLLPGPTPEEERLSLLRGAELLIATQLMAPADANDYRLNLLPMWRAVFVAKRDALQNLVEVPRPTLTELLADANAELPLTAFDPAPIDFTAEGEDVARFRTGLIAAVAALKKEVTDRMTRVDGLLVSHNAATGGDEKVRLLQDAAKVLFGEDFQCVPHVTLPADAAAELANAWEHGRAGALTGFLTATAGRDFPVDDWMHGVARVRDKMHHWENVVLLGDAFRLPPAELTPLQLPFDPADPWLALEMPPHYTIENDRLLYTAHYAVDFDSTRPVCGLLVDEWTEVIPGMAETTGIAFHYDRPNSEPPQAWLLALPSSQTGEWSWDELLAAVNDTLDAAKRRAIEPVHLDSTTYSWFLPATVSAYTFPEISISNNLLRNRKIYD